MLLTLLLLIALRFAKKFAWKILGGGEGVIEFVTEVYALWYWNLWQISGFPKIRNIVWRHLMTTPQLRKIEEFFFYKIEDRYFHNTQTQRKVINYFLEIPSGSLISLTSTRVTSFLDGPPSTRWCKRGHSIIDPSKFVLKEDHPRNEQAMITFLDTKIFK